MRTNRILAALIITLLCASAALAQDRTLKRIVTKTDRLDFGPGGTIAIVGAPVGSIRVEPASRNEVEVTAEITLESANEADLVLLEKVTGFLLQETLGRVAINSVGTHDKRYLKQVAKKFPKELVTAPFRIDYIVKVPRFSDLQIDGGRGDITVSAIEGAMRINSIEGTARLDLIGGGLNGTFGKGNVMVTIPDRSWRGSAIDVALASGELDVQLPLSLSAELDATVLRSGKIENSIVGLTPRVRTVRFTEQSISARAGGGGVVMKFTVGDGTLRLRNMIKAS